MFMFLMFALIDLVVIGIFYAVYGKKRKYSEGMLLGVHLPLSAAESGEVTAFMARYYRNTKRLYAVNMVISTALCAFCFWYLSVFMIVWCIWLLEFCVGAMALLYGSHRKLYDMKVERGWIGSSGSRIMAVDTKAAAQSGRMGVSALWHLLFCALILMPCIDADIRKYLITSDDGWVFLVTGLFAGFTFGILNAVILRMRNKVYSEDSDLNLKVSRMQKNVWSWALAGCGLFNAAAYLFVMSGIDKDGWISTGTLVIYCIMETIPGFLLIGVYTLGFVLPFLAVGLFTSQVLSFFRRHTSWLKYTAKAGGVLLILMGVMMFTGWMNSFTGYLSGVGTSSAAASSSQAV